MSEEIGQIQADRQATVTKMTTHNNHGMQKSVSKWPTHWSRWAPADWPTQNWKNSLSLIQSVVSQFSINKMKARIHLASVSGCWWCSNGMGDIYTHFGHLVPTEHCLKATAYSSIIANNVHPFIATVVHQCGYSQLTVSFLNMKLSPLHLHWVFPCWICAMKNLVGCEGKRGSNLILTRLKVCLIMWPLSVEQENIWL